MRTAKQVADPLARDSALYEITTRLAPLDPIEALRITSEIHDVSYRCLGLASVGKALAVNNPTRAVDLATGAPGKFCTDSILSDIVEVVDKHDPARAHRIAASITDAENKAKALQGVASQLISRNPGEARDALWEASLAASGMPEGYRKSLILRFIAREIAPLDSSLALQVARAIQDERDRLWALSEVAGGMAQQDVRAALQLAETLPTDAKAWALYEIVKSVATRDPAQGLDIAKSITDEKVRASALGAVTGPLASRDIDLAQQIAQSISDPDAKSGALREIGKVLISRNPARARIVFEEALRVVTTISDPVNPPRGRHLRDSAYAILIPALAHLSFDRAIEVAVKFVESPNTQAWQLRDLANMVVDKDQARARQLLNEALVVTTRIPNPDDKARSLRWIVEALAPIDLERALEVARTIPEPRGHAAAVTLIAKRIAATDPQRAIQIVRGIESTNERVEALVELAGTLEHNQRGTKRR